MPTYEYVCDECGRAEDHFFRTPDKAPQALEPCGGEGSEYCDGRMVRQIGSGAGLIFKGPGFYVNDYPKAEPVKEGKLNEHLLGEQIL